MLNFEEDVPAQIALRAYLRTDPQIPQELLEQLIAASDQRSAVAGAANMVDAVMAGYDDADVDLRELAAATATMMWRNGFHGYDQEDKGVTIAKQLRGEIPMPVKEEPPEPVEPLAAPEPIAEPPAPEPETPEENMP